MKTSFSNLWHPKVVFKNADKDAVKVSQELVGK